MRGGKNVDDFGWYEIVGCATVILLLFGNAIFYFGIRSKYVFIMITGSCVIFLASLITFLMLIHNILEQNLYI